MTNDITKIRTTLLYLWAVKTRMRSLPDLTPPPLSCLTGHLSKILALAPSARRMDSCMSLVMLRRVDMALVTNCTTD